MERSERGNQKEGPVSGTLELQSNETVNARLAIFSLQTHIKSGNRWQTKQWNNLKEESKDTWSLYFGENLKTVQRRTNRNWGGDVNLNI